MGGGIESGSSTLIIGPAGTGKSLLVLQFVAAAVKRGEHAALFIFDEELGLLFSRSKAMGIDLEAMRDSGKLLIVQMDAAEISPGEFAHKVRKAVEKDNIRTVVIDSLNGYQNAMPQEQYLILHMHELLQYLNRLGAATFLTVAQHGMVGDMKSPVDVTYLADTVMLLRYFEAFGQVRRAISMLKKRTGAHENTIREFTHRPQPASPSGPCSTNSRASCAACRNTSARTRRSWMRTNLEQAHSITISERAIILAPQGRDAPVAARILREGGLTAEICDDLPRFLRTKLQPAQASRC